MTPEWLSNIKLHATENTTYSLTDFEHHFSSKEARDGLADFSRRYRNRPMKFFSDNTDFSALVPPFFQAQIAEYGAVESIAQQISTNVAESREEVTKRFIWKSEGIEDYQQGERFKASNIEGAANKIRWRKPGAMLAATYEQMSDLPLDIMAANMRLTLLDFAERENRHFSHELHNATSDNFPNGATDKDGVPMNKGWRTMFDNTLDATGTDANHPEFCTWTDIKNGRQKMLRRARDAARPTAALINASTEAFLSESMSINNAAFLHGGTGDPMTYFATGSLPNIYGLRFFPIPDAFWGYFSNAVTRKNGEFVQTNDVLLIQPEAAVFRHTREPMTTETWRIYAEQKNAMSVWERYEFSTFKYTNILRIAKSDLV